MRRVCFVSLSVSSSVSFSLGKVAVKVMGVLGVEEEDERYSKSAFFVNTIEFVVFPSLEIFSSALSKSIVNFSNLTSPKANCIEKYCTLDSVAAFSSLFFSYHFNARSRR